MNIVVLNGSPKGAESITLQTVLYLQKKFPAQHFDIIHVGKEIRKLEKDMTEVIGRIEKAQVILFAYPVYTFIAPSQLHRFIRLLKKAGVSFKGKYVSQITTSKHFYDVTAHKYIEENSAEMGGRIIRGLSADMEDLLHPKGQKAAVNFFRYLLWSVAHRYYEKMDVIPVAARERYYAVGGLDPVKHEAKPDRPVVIITDCTDPHGQLASMIRAFRKYVGLKTKVVNIARYPLKGGCIGCFNCSGTGKCIYTDGFDTFLREEIQKASAMIYAFSIQDHSMGVRFKMYDDRQFCNGHRTVTEGMPIGYLVDGVLQSESNLKLILEARANVGGNFYCGAADDAGMPDEEIRKLAAHVAYAIEHQLVLPRNFYGVGGMKIFRDLIFQMQGLMRADHKFFKRHGQYDFPQKKIGTIAGMYLVGAMMNNKKIKSKIGGKMTEGMLLPYKKLLEKQK